MDYSTFIIRCYYLVSTNGVDLIKEKFNFPDQDKSQTEVPQNPFAYLIKAFKDTPFRALQYNMLMLSTLHFSSYPLAL